MAQTTEFVLLLGMERYLAGFFKQVEAEVRRAVPGFRLRLFEDRDTLLRRDELEAAITRCDCLFMALITMAEHAEWLAPTVLRHDPPLVFSFEGMPEIMRLNKVGSYNLRESTGMPKPVQNVARLLVGGREEDIFYGYVKLSKLMRRLVNVLPGRRLADFRNWTNVNAYWNNRSVANMANMFKLILREYCGYPGLAVTSPAEIPTMGFAHPDAPHLFAKPEEYLRWEAGRARSSARSGSSSRRGSVALLSFRAHILGGAGYHDKLVRALEARDMRVVPIFCMGIENHVAVREWLPRLGIDLLINTMGFPLVGGPAGATKAGLTTSVARELLVALDVPYIVAQPLLLQEIADWRERGVGPLQSTILYSLPEMDGAVAPVVLGGVEGGAITTIPDRLERLAQLSTGLIGLRQKPNRDKQIAIVVYSYPPGVGKTATAALLDVPASLIGLLRRLRDAGYSVGPFPDDPQELARLIESATRPPQGAGQAAQARPCISRAAFHDWLRPTDQRRIEARWGQFPGEIAAAGNDSLFLGSMQVGNIYIGVQPAVAIPGDPLRLLFDRENAPHHQYALFYRWLSRELGADAIIHLGMHGTAEWMPGLQLGVSADCWPDLLLGEVPNVYVYPINNPAEANIAKRRGYSTIVGHAVPLYGRAGLYKELQALKDLLEESRTRAARGTTPSWRMEAEASQGAEPNPDLAVEQEPILAKIAVLGLDNDLARRADEPFDAFASRAYAYLRELEQTLIVDGLHILGAAPAPEQQLALLCEALKLAHDDLPSLADLVLSDERAVARDSPGYLSYEALLEAARRGEPQANMLRERVDHVCAGFVQRAVIEGQQPERALAAALGRAPGLRHPSLGALVDHGRALLTGLRDNRGELDFLLHALEGGYVPAGPGGDLLRDGLAVLPTGRNIHGLDPFRIPSDGAYRRGAQIAAALLDAHRAESGDYPETIAQVLWGLDTIKTRGEAIGTVLALVGARPLKDGQGKIARYELLPLEQLGRPRIDMLLVASGIFRDTFAGTIDMLDRLFREAASADEPPEQNFIRKHVQALVADGISVERATARIFTQAPGSYGTDVDDAVEGGVWERREELEELFVRRSAFAYGGMKGGEAHAEVLDSLLGTVGHVSQQIDSVEYGLTDMQHYYGYSGALKAAAERRTGQPVGLSFVESFSAAVQLRPLEQALRIEYRTKLLNPKWYEGMLRHGHSGAAEIAGRLTYMVGWSATTGAVEGWVYDAAAATFVLDEAMRARIEQANPEAARSLVGRLLEASSRGFWQADEATIARLRELYADLEDHLEGISC